MNRNKESHLSTMMLMMMRNVIIGFVASYVIRNIPRSTIIQNRNKFSSFSNEFDFMFVALLPFL